MKKIKLVNLETGESEVEVDTADMDDLERRNQIQTLAGFIGPNGDRKVVIEVDDDGTEREISGPGPVAVTASQPLVAEDGTSAIFPGETIPPNDPGPVGVDVPTTGDA